MLNRDLDPVFLSLNPVLFPLCLTYKQKGAFDGHELNVQHTAPQAVLDDLTFRDSKTKRPTAVVPDTGKEQSLCLPLELLL